MIIHLNRFYRLIQMKYDEVFYNLDRPFAIHRLVLISGHVQQERPKVYHRAEVNREQMRAKLKRSTLPTVQPTGKIQYIQDFSMWTFNCGTDVFLKIGTEIRHTSSHISQKISFVFTNSQKSYQIHKRLDYLQ